MIQSDKKLYLDNIISVSLCQALVYIILQSYSLFYFFCYNSHMAVKDINTRILVVLPNEYADYIKERAKKEDRSISKMTAILLKAKIDEEKRS